MKTTKNFSNSKKGFTLVELLVILVIFVALTIVVISSIRSGRENTSDSSIVSSLVNIIPTAELQYNAKGCYTNTASCSPSTPALLAAGVCPSLGDARLFGLASISDSISAIDKANSSYYISCASTQGGTAWAIAAQYKSANQKGWCVDSTGSSYEVNVASPYGQGNLNSIISGAKCN